MQGKLLLWGSALALATTATADQAKPKIYFPRHVKRQFTNSTITSHETFPPPESTPFTTRNEPTDLLSSLRNVLPGSSDSSSGDSSSSGDRTITTVVISSTVRVSPTRTSEPPENGSSSIEISEESSAPPSSTTSSSRGLPLTNLLPPILFPTPGDRSSSSTLSEDDEPTSSGIVIGPSGIVSSSAPPADTTSSVSSTSSSSSAAQTTTTGPRNPLDPIISIVTSLLPPLPTNTTESEAPPSRTSEPSGAETSSTTPPPLLPSISLPPILPPASSSSGEPEPPISNSTISEPPPEPTPPPSGPSSSESFIPSSSFLPPDPIGNDTSTISEPSLPPSATPSDLPAGSSVPTNTSDSEPTPSPTSSAEPSSVPSLTSTPPANTVTQSWLPTTIIVQHSTPTRSPTDGTTATTTVAMPSDLPKVIGPDDPSDLDQPDGTVELQVGFLYAMNWEFVSRNPMAAAQMFTYLPMALADGGGIDRAKVKVTRLVPFDTRQSLGYVTTLARFYYPESMIDQLRMDVKIASSPLYNHPIPLVYNLTQLINPAIEIVPGMESDAGGNGDDSTSSGAPRPDDMFDNNESESTPIQRGTAAAIGIGAVGVAAAYGAAMFLIARRYKQKKQAHRRSSSIANSSEMRYNGAGSPAMMGGALLSRDFSGYGGVAGGREAGGRDSHGSGRSGAGNSGRTAYISAPVAAENSLGWN